MGLDEVHKMLKAGELVGKADRLTKDAAITVD